MSQDELGEPNRQTTSIGKLLPWLLGICLCCFAALIVVGVFDALRDSSLLARNTPTPAFLTGTEVKLDAPAGESVTVWQVSGNCEAANALGKVPSGSDARILEDTCYHRRSKTYYQRITLANGSEGWVEANSIVSIADYIPAEPTETPRPSSTPWPTPTPQPTLTPIPPPLPMGSPFSVGNWGVRVDRVETAESLTSPSGDKTVTADGRFAFVFLTVTNHGPRARTLHASSAFIVDEAGQRYINNDQASAYASSADCPDFALDIAPDETVCMMAAIDISAQGNTYLFSLQGADDYVLLEVP